MTKSVRMTERDLLNLIDMHEKAAMGGSTQAANIATSGTTTQYGALDVERAQAMDYYHGRPLGNEVEGRSQIVSPEVRDTIEWIKPQLLRMFVASDEMVRFEPENPQDEQESEQATDIVNYLMMRANDGVIVLHDFFTDALMLKNGYVKCWYEEVERDVFENYTGLDPESLTYIVQQIEEAGDKANIVAKEVKQGMTQMPDGSLQPNITLDIRIRRTTKRGEYKMEAIAPEDMRVSPVVADDFQNSPFVAHVVRKTRGELKEMGYNADDDPRSDETRIGIQSIARSDTIDELGSDSAGMDKTMEIVECLEAYIRVDYDGDGVAELRKVFKAPGKVLKNETTEVIPIAYCTPIRMPHRHLGISIFDLLKDLQDIKTTLIRQALDNTYLVNHGRFVVGPNVNLDDFEVARPGGYVRTRGNPGEDVVPISVQPIAQMILPVIDYIDSMKSQRTGISATTQGLDPDTLQATTAKAYTNAMSAATAKIELMARLMAEGVKQIGLLLHGLVIRHQDKPMVIKLRNNWVPIDPTSWRRRYSCSINVGLGSGSRDEMRQNLMLMGQMQQQAAQVGIVQPDNVFALVSELSQVLGFKTPGKYFTDPASPQFQQAMQQRQQQHPDSKVQAAQITAQAGVQKAQIQAQGNIAQVQAEQQMHQQDLQIKMQMKGQEMAQDFAKANQSEHANLVAQHMKTRQQHDEALMNLLGMQQTNDSQERQNFIKTLGSTIGGMHGQ